MSKPIVSFGACLLSACAGIFATDTITLKSGGTVEGQVIRDTPKDPLIAINTGGKLLLLNRDEITAITLDEEGRAEFQRRRDALQDKNAAGHFELYKWAQSQRLYDYADQQLSATLKAEPGHAEARKIVYAAATLSKKSAEVAAPIATAAVEDTLVIGLRHATPEQRLRSEFDEKIISACKKLLPGAVNDESLRKAAVAEVTKTPLKATETVLTYLDPAVAVDEQVRLASLAGIEVLKPISPEVSKKLGQAAMTDPSPNVRKQSSTLIKSRNDEWAMDGMVKSYIACYEDGGSIRDPITKVMADAALRDLDLRRVYGQMYYYATLEVRTANVTLGGFVTRQIDSFITNPNGGIANGVVQPAIIPLSFPIQFPELKIMRVNTTVKAPCAAMSALSGLDLGNDIEAWAKFLRKQK